MKALSVRRVRWLPVAVAAAFLASGCVSIAAAGPDPVALRSGTNFLATTVHPAGDDQKVLQAFEGLRVADVCDGMDAVGLPGTGLMNLEIRPLWRDTETCRHRFIGIAVTVRYVPTQDPPAGARSVADYDRLGLPADPSVK